MYKSKMRKTFNCIPFVPNEYPTHSPEFSMHSRRVPNAFPEVKKEAPMMLF
jgi:hypothetical protein